MRNAVDPTPTPGVPYSRAVHGTPVLQVSGQLGLDPATGALVAGSAADQLRQALANLDRVLADAGKTEADVLKVGLYLTDMADFAAVNEVYAEHFSTPYPARTAICVVALPRGAVVEVDAVVG